MTSRGGPYETPAWCVWWALSFFASCRAPEPVLHLARSDGGTHPHADPAAREEAADALWAAGATARPVLALAAAHASPDVRWRAAELAQAIEAHDGARRVRAIAALERIDHPSALAALAALTAGSEEESSLAAAALARASLRD